MDSLPVKTKHWIVRDSYERVVFGEVYIPGQVDSHGTTMTKDEIKRVAYDFMRKMYSHRIDEQHSWEESGCYAIESFIARDDDQVFVPGSWVLGTQIVGDELWNKVLNGELNGYSIAGYANKQKALVDLTRVSELEVETEVNLAENIQPHSHMIHLIFDNDGHIIPTWTTDALNHTHEVILSTATESELDHNHRFVCRYETIEEST